MSSFFRLEIPAGEQPGEYRLTSRPMSLPIIISKRRESRVVYREAGIQNPAAVMPGFAEFARRWSGTSTPTW